MKFLLRLLFKCWLYAIAICVLVGIPALAIFDQLNPWLPAVEALSTYTGQHRLCVGQATSTKIISGVHHSSAERSFLLVPRILQSPSVITVRTIDDTSAVVSESRRGFWFLLGISICAFVFWFRLFYALVFRSRSQV